MGWCGASGEMARLGFIYSHECIKLVFGLAWVSTSKQGKGMGMACPLAMQRGGMGLHMG